MRITGRIQRVEIDEQGKPHTTTTTITDDDRHWREPTLRELAKLPAEALVYFGRGEPHPAGEFADLRFPGDYPFLAGLAALGPPVYVEAKCPICGSTSCQAYATGTHQREPSCWCGQEKPCAKHLRVYRLGA